MEQRHPVPGRLRLAAIAGDVLQSGADSRVGRIWDHSAVSPSGDAGEAGVAATSADPVFRLVCADLASAAGDVFLLSPDHSHATADGLWRCAGAIFRALLRRGVVRRADVNSEGSAQKNGWRQVTPAAGYGVPALIQG